MALLMIIEDHLISVDDIERVYYTYAMTLENSYLVSIQES